MVVQFALGTKSDDHTPPRRTRRRPHYRRCHSNFETGKMKFTVRRYDPVQTVDDASPVVAKRALSSDVGGNGIDGSGDGGVGGGRENGTPVSLAAVRGISREDSVSSSFYSADAGIVAGSRRDLPRGDFARRGRLFARRHKRRLVFKDGECNISLSNVSKRKRRFLGDMFTTFLDMKWRYNLMMFAMAFVMSWLVFALLWWLIAWAHDDHSHVGDANWEPCMIDVYDFTTALLFSVETQHTIGYGSRSMNTQCPEAVFLLMLQSCTGVFIQSMLTGIIFAKLSRPKGRAHTIMFSKTAVICQRDGQYCLLFRVADMRKSHIVGACLRATMVRNRITKEGELLPMGQIPLDVQPETCFSDGNIFLVWPVTVMHKIDDSSPFWEMSAEQLLSERFEIVVFLEGTVESTGMTTQVRTSYLPSEILWGHRLGPLFTYQKENGQYKIDYTAFHTTHPVRMPECSAKAYEEGDYEEHSDSQEHTDVTTNYYTENSFMRKPTHSFFKHKLHRRNTTDPNAPGGGGVGGGGGGLERLEEVDAGSRTDGDESPRRRLKRPKWMNGFFHFWSQSDISKAQDIRSEVDSIETAT